MSRTFRLAILSDLHAAPKSVTSPPGEVKLFTDQNTAAATEHPLKGLEQLISTEALRAEAVVCPGDMTNKANPQALEYVWNGLQKLRTQLHAKNVIATVGNHDVDSRGHSPNSFPRESLMRLQPPFPAGESKLSDRYWAHGYFIRDLAGLRYLVINTCWLHESRDEVERGVITDYTLERISSELSKLPKAKTSVAVFHHHPHPHSDLGLGFDDVIRNGQKLLDLLAGNDQWLVLHGHKHHPKLEYAQGQFRQPIVFACGSFSGRIEGDNALVSKNYFHIIELDLENARMQGRIYSWTWIPGLGWTKYSSNEPSFPTEAGFGCVTDISFLAAAVKSALGSGTLKSWASMTSTYPDLRFLMPKQFSALVKLLSSEHKIALAYDKLGRPEQLGPEIQSG